MLPKGSLLVRANEREILEKLIAGDLRELAQLYDHFAAPLNGLLQNELPKGMDIGLIVYQTFIKIWEEKNCYPDTYTYLFTWIHEIALRCSEKPTLKNEEDVPVVMPATQTHSSLKSQPGSFS